MFFSNLEFYSNLEAISLKELFKLLSSFESISLPKSTKYDLYIETTSKIITIIPPIININSTEPCPLLSLTIRFRKLKSALIIHSPTILIWKPAPKLSIRHYTNPKKPAPKLSIRHYTNPKKPAPKLLIR